MITEADLIRVADAYAVAAGVEEKTVSHRVFGDSKKLTAIRAGKDITVRRLNDALAWFSTNWPQNAIWPKSVTRPFRPDPLQGDGAAPRAGEAASLDVGAGEEAVASPSTRADAHALAPEEIAAE
jgi:hypothetical protein